MFEPNNRSQLNNQDSRSRCQDLTAKTNKRPGSDPGDEVKYFGGRTFSHESWLHIPTFLRQGKKLQIG